MNRSGYFFQKHKNLTCGLLFAAFMFVQLVVLCLANGAGQGFLSDACKSLPYFFKQAVVIAGFLAHALLYPILHRLNSYRSFLFALLAFCAAGSVQMLFIPAGSLFYIVLSAFTVLSLGFVGGAVYLKMSFLAANGAKVGIAFGIGYASAIALQYLLQLQWTLKPALAFLLVLSFAALFLMFLSFAHDREAAPAKEPRKTFLAKPLFCIVVTLAMLTFITYFNSYVHDAQIPYGWPRLLMIPAVLLLGLLGDLKNGRFLPLGALCIAVISLLNIVLAGPENDTLNLSLYYISLSSVVVYYHLTFLRLAPKTGRPALWAMMGRMLDSFLVIVSFLIDYRRLSSVAVLIIEIAALVAAVVFMAVNGDFNFSSSAGDPSSSAKDEPQAPPAEGDAVDPFPLIEEEFGVSPGEMKVLRELVLTEDKQEAIADRLHISVSTLRHHITSIYRKTDTQSRLALCNLVESRRKK